MSLVALRIRLDNMGMADPEMPTFGRIAPLFERSDLALEHLVLSGITLTRGDVETMLASPITAKLKGVVVPPMGVDAAELVAGGLRSHPHHEAMS